MYKDHPDKCSNVNKIGVPKFANCVMNIQDRVDNNLRSENPVIRIYIYDNDLFFSASPVLCGNTKRHLRPRPDAIFNCGAKIRTQPLIYQHAGEALRYCIGISHRGLRGPRPARHKRMARISATANLLAARAGRIIIRSRLFAVTRNPACRLRASLPSLPLTSQAGVCIRVTEEPRLRYTKQMRGGGGRGRRRRRIDRERR